MEEVGFCSSSTAIDSSNVGFQLLKKCGWKEGTGLGISEQGRLEPVQTHVNKNKRGLGAGKTKQTNNLQVKKMKVLQGGAPADSVRTCEICNVVCNSDKVFACHLAGEKHKLRVSGMPLNYASKPISTTKAATSTSEVRASFCDLCKVTCDSQEAFNAHVSGNEHQTNLNPNIAKTDHGAGAVKVVDDLEAKKMKVVSGGAAASAVKVCTYCNVVCNSQHVYNSHVVGRRHVANVAKLQQPAPTV